MFKRMGSEFRDFVNRGNVVDLAVAVVIGAAFASVVKSFTDDLLGQLLAAVGGQPKFDDLKLTLRTITDATGAQVTVDLRYGSFLTAVVNFLIVAFAMFLVVKGFNHLQRLRHPDETEEEATATELDVLKEIRDAIVETPATGDGSADGSSAQEPVDG